MLYIYFRLYFGPLGKHEVKEKWQ